MTDWKKTYSTWFNVVASVAAAITAAALYLQTQNVPWAPMVIVAITAFTVFLRSLPQPEPPPKRPAVRVEERGWVPLYLLPLLALFAFISLFLIACTRTPAQVATRETCLVAAETRHNGRADAECNDQGYAWDAEHKAKLVAEAQAAGDKEAEAEALALELCPARADIMADLKAEQEKCR